MPEKIHTSAVDTVLTVVFFFLALCLLYMKIQIENVLIPRLEKKYREWRYC
ncbi:hypothetical protein [Natrinema salinisoli]|uniref:hypothetical protein n=1 Tax=Natrinema salinisoli TaxID=2878535 RepID=UPI001CEFE9EF|nr:hypothetical protein [Natrinema salinisoli]